MDNRRADYRHTFSTYERPRVELSTIDAKKSLAGLIVNVSLGGMKIILDDPAERLALKEIWLVRFTIPPAGVEMKFESLVCHIETETTDTCYSFRFLPLSDLRGNEAREKTLWQYLLAEQRRLYRAS